LGVAQTRNSFPSGSAMSTQVLLGRLASGGGRSRRWRRRRARRRTGCRWVRFGCR
jgi:hypothetical protein